jgi:hypothetical protein
MSQEQTVTKTRSIARQIAREISAEELNAIAGGGECMSWKPCVGNCADDCNLN